MSDLPPVTTSPWSTRRARALDVGLVAAGLLGAVVTFGSAGHVPALLSAVQVLPLLVRRTRPVLCFALVSLAMVVQLPLTDVPIWGQVAMPVAVYSVAAFAPRLPARVALGVALLAGVVGPVDWSGAYTGTSLLNLLALIVSTELTVVAGWTLGSLTRTRRAYVAALVDRGHRLELEAAQRAELAASDERARIAREMHDVVAHGLSVIIVQADGASYAVDKDPASASRALQAISGTGREALGEMRRLLGLLRSDDTGAHPQPGAAELPYLVEQSRAAGMDLVSSVDPMPDVSAGVGLTTYRVVQEALTNVRKHGGPEPHVDVRVELRDAAVHVTVTDDGRGPSGDDGTGHGLLGMRERVAVHGGRLETGPRPGGGFLVRATIPTSERPPG